MRTLALVATACYETNKMNILNLLLGVKTAFATGTLTASDTLPIVQGGIETLKDTLVAFLPVILPVAIVLAIFFGAYYWIKHAGHGR